MFEEQPPGAYVRVLIVTALDATQREVRISRKNKVGELIPEIVMAFGVPTVSASGKLLTYYLAIATLAPLSRSITLEDVGVVDGTRRLCCMNQKKVKFEFELAQILHHSQ